VELMCSPANSFGESSDRAELNRILHELSQPDALANVQASIELCQKALRLVHREQDPEIWAILQMMSGLLAAESPYGLRGGNLELAIDHYEQALTVYTVEDYPQDWAKIQKNLANACYDRIHGDRADNLERALTVYTREAYPQDWARTQNNLAGAYLNRIRGDRADNLERAIGLYEQALTVLTREAYPQDWARTQSNLANAYRDRIRERADNLERAIGLYEQALTVLTREAYPQEWARTQHNLAIAYSDRVRGERTDNLERAIYHYEQALTVRTREAYPQDWARTLVSLADAYRNRIRGERAENVERAIQHCEKALTIYTAEVYPQEWARAQHNMGSAYHDRIRGERAENLERAIHHFEQALTVYGREAFPQEWATIHDGLGNAYGNRIRGERAENLERAIAYFGQALTVFSSEAFPQDWARIQSNLANVYWRRIRGERAENLERAIRLHQQALTVHTREAIPQEWARIQNNLASAYCGRIHGERAENLEWAINHYEQALTVRTREAYPQDWAGTQNDLAGAYWDRIRGERGENLERAIKHCEQALTVYSREAYPQDWARMQDNLANAYTQRIRGERGENLKQAVQHWEQALSFFTLDRFPHDHRRIQRNLGHLYIAEGNWAAAYPAYADAIEAGSAVLAMAYTEIGRQAEVGETARLHAAAAYCLLSLKRPAEAFVALEHGKTRLLAEALALGEADLASLPENQRQAMHAGRQGVRQLEAEMRLPANTPARRSDRAIAEALHQARAELQNLIATIRTRRPDFMPTGLNLPGLLRLLPPSGALVCPLATSQGGAAFVLPYGASDVTEAEIVWLDGLTDRTLLELLRGPADVREWGGWFGAYFNQRTEWQRWLGAIETTGRTLWELLLVPVHQRLQELGLGQGAPVIMMPQGGLGLLPLHAAWREADGGKRYFLDDYTVSYAPSGYALHISQCRIQESGRQQHTLLAVVNPTADLAFTRLEGEAVTTLFAPAARQVLVEQEASSDAVVVQSPGRSYLHFACHGFYNWQDVMSSGLILAGGAVLTLSEIISRLNLSGARLVTLSACETGVTDIRQSPDEYLGLPAGFLQAGAPAVLSTLWPVEDLSTRLLIEQFYRYHLEDGQAPALALRKAQIWLRDSSAEALALVDQRKHVYETTTDQEVKRKALLSMRYHEKHPEDRPFCSSYYWAPFTFTGA
jgi:CHAT domain-containing protein/tetratricopeptide (TPR) repeat protein